MKTTTIIQSTEDFYTLLARAFTGADRDEAKRRWHAAAYNAELPSVARPAQRQPDFRYISHCREGYDTILGYLAKYHPTRLELIDQEPEATQRDGYWCMHRARERGLKVVKVRAPAFLSDAGIEFVNSYPITLLRERLE